MEKLKQPDYKSIPKTITLNMNIKSITEINTSGFRNIKRSNEITTQYLTLLDTHLNELINGKTDVKLKLKDIAGILCVSQKHFIKTIQETNGFPPSHFYIQKIMEQTKILLSDSNYTIAEIAERLTYDHTNFTKFFKKYEKKTPSEYRIAFKKSE